MDNLSTAVTSNGSDTSVVGEGQNAVFGLGQCFQDLGTIDCKLCFSEIKSRFPSCYPYIGGRLYLDGCFGRYENYSFFYEITGSEDTRICSTGNDSLNLTSFNQAVKEVISNVTSLALKNSCSCFDAAASSILTCALAKEGCVLFAGCYIRYST